MKKLVFKFFNANECIIDEACDYIIKNSFIEFDVRNAKYSFFLGDNFYFSKEDGEGVFELISNHKEKMCNYTLKEGNYKMDIDLSYFDYKQEGNEHTILYTLESDEEALKKIILSFD